MSGLLKTESKVLPCTVKPAVGVRVGDSKVDFHSGCSVVDVTFSNVFYVEIQEIHFKNFYTAQLAILVKQKENPSEGGGGSNKWKVCLRRMTLMPHPHCETGGEDYFILAHKQMALPLINITAVRFVLRQPSPVWKEFRIEDIKLYKQCSQPSSVTVSLPSWLNDNSPKEPEGSAADKQLKGVPSISGLSRDLQSMWALTEQARLNQTKISLGRYDVDNCYEINLLSYT